MKGKWIPAACVMSILAIAPLIMPAHWIKSLTLVLLFVLWACAWNIIGGLGGEINFLHPLFIGAGAYVSTMLYLQQGISPWAGMVIGGLVASLLGVVLGAICYRSGLPHLSFALITLGFTYIGQIIASSWEYIGGSVGLMIRPNPGFWRIQFETNTGYYYVTLVFALMAVAVTVLISRSRLGYYLAAIRHNEQAAEAVGVDSVRIRLTALAISAFLTAGGGTLYTQIMGYIEPHSAVNIEAVIEVIMFAVVGGYGTVWGPVVGTFLLMPIGELIRAVWPGLHLVIYGVIVIAVIMFAPNGVAAWIETVLSVGSRPRQPIA